ncbi:MAG: FKBP-type peptidyl-prolyl cis-trans isomerase [Acidimicrobiia bacterium]
MGSTKRERKKAGHRARLELEHRLDRRDRRRRRALITGSSVVGVLAFGALLWAVSKPGTSATTAPTSTSSTTTSTLFPELPSAAGKPCIDVTDPLPAGAPSVPMPVGTVPTSLVVTDLTVGSGTPVVATDDVTVQYIGVACSTGLIFDSTWTRGQPATFGLDQVIPGWTQGLVGMQPGGRRLLVIPSDLGYGPSGQGAKIGPDEALVFVVDLISATPAATPTTAAPN